MPQATESWIARFPGLTALPEELCDALLRGSAVVAAASGSELFAPGQAADHLLLLLEGSVRVQQISDTGREVVLYRVRAGESCVLTTACMLAFEDYAATGVAETDIRAVMIPRRTFDTLVAQSDVFRQFVFTAYARRITDLFALIDDIVFRRMDVRLAARLLELAREGDVVAATHQTLAGELGTAREVVSRILADFQRRGLIEQARGEVRLIRRDALERHARAARDL